MRKTVFSKVGRKIFAFFASLIILFCLLDWIWPVQTTIEYSPVILARDGTVMHSFLTKDEQWRMYTRLDEITPELKKAIVFKEDKYFYYHFGINPFAICRAAINNIFYWKRTSGASTITMQVARMLRPKRRTYFNKIIEAFRALQLEVYYSKQEILQLYLNLVPYGSNIQGVKAASLLYFQKTPDQLSLAQITALSIIPNRPNSMVIGKDNDKIVYERNKWLYRFKDEKVFSEAIIKDAVEEPLNAYRHNAPGDIPHLAYKMKSRFPGLHEIRTTIARREQMIAEEITRAHIATLRQFNIYNASVLIIDNETREVLCYIGSSHPYDYAHNGAVDGVNAQRSPGSTLKPFLYALCMDKGFITPKTIMADVPVNYEGYMPENFDLNYRGNITAEEALQKSLNIPAVKLLNKLSAPNFIASLTNAGCHTIWKQRKHLGLSMILGGCTIRLRELTALYATMANNGKYAPLVFTRTNDSARKKYTQIISPAAAYLTSKIITGLYRPDLPNLYDKSQNLPRISWKTGTSYGRKDAWSIGYNEHYTIGVWIGNFNGKGVPEINGASIATPLLFNLFRAIDKNAGDDNLKAPAGVSMRFVCVETGKPPDELCEKQVYDEYIPGISSNEVCNHVRNIWVSADEKISYCTSCVPPSGYKTKAYTRVSPELASFYKLKHIKYEKYPPHNPECNRLFDGPSPVINSLTDKMTYIITDKGKQKLQLNCRVANDVRKVYWYINDQFIGGAAATENVFFIPQASDIKISCTDDKGRTSEIRIQVSFI